MCLLKGCCILVFIAVQQQHAERDDEMFKSLTVFRELNLLGMEAATLGKSGLLFTVPF